MTRAVTTVISACCMLAACASAGTRARTRAADARAAIAAAQLRWDSVARAADAEANAELFTEDAVVGLGGLADVRGRPAILAAMRGFYRQYAVQAEQHHTVELEIHGDAAYDRGTYLFVSGPRGGPAKTERGRYSAVWHRGADGAWRVYRYLENLLPGELAQ